MTRELLPGIYRTAPSRTYPKGGYEVRYRDPVTHRARRKTFRTQKEAETFKYSKHKSSQADEANAATSFRVVAERWLAADGHEWRPKTRVGYTGILNYSVLGDRKDGQAPHAMPEFAFMAIGGERGIRIGHVKTLLGKLAAEGASVGTRRNVLTVISLVMNYAIDNEMRTEANPARFKLKMTNDGSTPPHEMAILTEPEVALLAEEVGPEYSTLIYFAAYSGMRAGEIGALRQRDVDLLRRKVEVRASLSDVNGKQVEVPPKTKSGRRAVAIPWQVADMLAVHVADKKPGDLVFPGPHGGYLRHGNFYGRVFRPAVARLVARNKLPEEKTGLRFHDLRHTCASLLISQGIHPKLIQAQLGHSSIMVTMDVYGKLFETEHDKVADALDAIFERGTDPSPPATVTRIAARG